MTADTTGSFILTDEVTNETAAGRSSEADALNRWLAGAQDRLGP